MNCELLANMQTTGDTTGVTASSKNQDLVAKSEGRGSKVSTVQSRGICGLRDRLKNAQTLQNPVVFSERRLIWTRTLF